jgi:hypothetical protein
MAQKLSYHTQDNWQQNTSCCFHLLAALLGRARPGQAMAAFRCRWQYFDRSLFAFYGDLRHDNASSIHYQGMPPNRPLWAALAWFWQYLANSRAGARQINA